MVVNLAGVSTAELHREVERRDRAESFVGVCCQSGRGCHNGGYFPDDLGSMPIDDDGREFVSCGDGWICPDCAEPGACQATGCPRTFASKEQANAEGWAGEWLDSCGVHWYWCPDHCAERQAVVDANGGSAPEENDP